MSSRMLLRQNFYLIGDADTQIVGNKLPSKLEVLKVFFFHTRILKSTLRQSAAITINEVKVFWDKANLPSQRSDHCIDKLLKLYSNYQDLQKHKDRESHREKEENFVLTLNNLFDIAHKDILQLIDGERLEFIVNQRKEGRVGYIANIEPSSDVLKRERNEERENAQCHVIETISTHRSEVSNYSLSQQKTTSSHSNFSDEPDHLHVLEEERKRGTINIINEKLVATLDRCKISDRNAVYLIVAVAEALKFDVRSLTVNRSSIRRYREQMREAKMESIKQMFDDVNWKAGVLHWDGKMLPNIMNREMTERLPVIISSGKKNKLLSIPELENGSGNSQATALYEVIVDWGLSDSIKAICCDTTPSNLGCINGAAVLLEQFLDRNLLYLPCRHHIFELVLRAVFEKKIPATTGPNVLLFKRFQNTWTNIDQNQYESGIENDYVREILVDHIDRINTFVENNLENIHPREDYVELLLLSQIFIGKASRDNVKIRKPGAFHHARWMSKAIYALKIFLFRKQFKLKPTEEKSISEICIFIVMIYIQAWFTCPLATRAANHDLQFIKNVCDYKSIDSDLSKVSLQKIKNHLWYLNDESAAMAFFDETLSDDVKRQMVLKLDHIDDSEVDSFKRVIVKNMESLYDLEIDSFISSRSKKFFERFEINQDFLLLDPVHWPRHSSYIEGLHLVTNLRDVNDTAERAIK